jgi:hypothetical protein
MNCANHPDIAAGAYCRTCGKPLCVHCTRDVKGVIYCENCLAERLQGVQPTSVPPTAGFVQSTPHPVMPGSGPNPTVAGILAGFFPFGVGAVYCGQYAKGLAHLVTFTLLVWGESVVDNAGLNTILGFGIAFFYVWQIIDAVRTAKALQLGQPAPDPMGLGRAFGAGEKTDSSRIPTAAIVLIGLGALFLLQTMGIFEFNSDRLWPVFLIGLGVWLMVRRLGWLRSGMQACCGTGSLTGPVVLITVGILSLSEAMDGPRWHRTWPILLLAIGITRLLERRTPPSPPPAGPGLTGGSTSDVPAPPSEVSHG